MNGAEQRLHPPEDLAEVAAFSSLMLVPSVNPDLDEEGCLPVLRQRNSAMNQSSGTCSMATR
jgi:hypothetical protein